MAIETKYSWWKSTVAPQEAARQLDESLQRLQVDCIDLVQHHEIIRYEDPHRVFDEEGANAALIEARKLASSIHWLYGHKDPKFICWKLQRAGFKFDAVQLPLNVMDAHYRSHEAGCARTGQTEHRHSGHEKHGKRDSFTVKYGNAHWVSTLWICPHQLWLRNWQHGDSDQAFAAVRTFQPMNDEQVRSLLAKNSRSGITRRVWAIQNLINFWRHCPESRLAWRRATAHSAIDVGVIGVIARGYS